MTMQQRITEKLQNELSPSMLEVINQSHLHAGHAGDDGSGESHFKIKISAETFGDIARVARERMIYAALADEMKIIHALTIKFI